MLLWESIYREGLDIPEVSLVAILMQTNKVSSETKEVCYKLSAVLLEMNGKVILYADGMSPSMSAAIQQTLERRATGGLQYCPWHHPKTIKKHFLQCQRMKNSSQHQHFCRKQTPSR